MTDRDAVPTTPAAQWRANGEPDPHGKQYDCERAALTLGELTDDELANGAFMNYDRRQSLDELLNPKPGQHMPIVWMTAAKERIRWLSRALERALAAHHIPDASNMGAVQAEAVRDVLAERLRQVTAEGWTTAHDDEYLDGELAGSAACYCLGALGLPYEAFENFWPWDEKWWKPTNRRRDLVKAGALILAEIECIDRAASSAGDQEVGS